VLRPESLLACWLVWNMAATEPSAIVAFVVTRALCPCNRTGRVRSGCAV